MSIHSSLNMKTTLLLITLLCSISKLTFSQFCDTSNANTFSDCYLKTTFDDSITIQVDSAGWYNMGCQTESIINIDSTSIWHIANAQKSGFDQAYSGNKVIVTDSIQTNKMGWMIDDIQTFQTFYPGNISETTSQFKTFPNPAKKLLNVKILTSYFQPNWIEIFSISGAVIISEKYQPSIDINELSSGIYFLRVSDGKSIGNTIKFIKE